MSRALIARDRERLAGYDSNLAFYEGKQWPTSRLRPERLRRLTMNYTRALVTKAASYTMKGASTAVEPRNEDAAPAALAEEALSDIAMHNGLASRDIAAEIDCAVLGDGAFKVGWDAGLGHVAVATPDVRNLYPEPHPTDPLRFPLVRERMFLTRAQTGAAYGVDPGQDGAVMEEWTDDLFVLRLDGDGRVLRSEPNPYGFAPYVIYPNERQAKRWYGASDIPAFREAAEELNREFSRLANIMELSGNPIAAVSGVEDLENADLAVQPGAVWLLPPDARADVFDLLRHGAATQHLAYVDLVQRTLHDLSETPRTAFGDNERDLSGVALQVELQPLLQKVDRKRAIRSEAYAARAGMALAILDQFTGTSHLLAGRIVINWDAPTPYDRSRVILDEDVLVRRALSSRRAALLRLGERDPDAEIQRINDERREIERVTVAVDSTAEPA